MTADQVSDEDAAAIGRIMIEAADKVRLNDKFCPGAVTVVHLFVEGAEFSVFVQVNRDA